MNRRWLKKISAWAGFVAALAWSCAVYGAPVMEKQESALRKAFPGLPFESVSPTDIKGVYEVISGGNIYYYFLEKDYLFVGDIYAPPGRNITAEKKSALAEAKLKDIPLDKAVKIGSGKTVVIEFTDPDCPFCKKAYEFFKNRSDLTRYVFLTPMAHPAAITKVYYILDSGDREKAYHEMFEGKSPVAPAKGYSEAAKKLAQEYLALARSTGVTGTPTFVINGKIVVGADFKRIEKLLAGASSAK